MSKKLERTHYAKIAIVGPSGTGKSYLSKTANKKTTGLINFERKPLPYKTEPFINEGRPKTWAGFLKNLKEYADDPNIENIIVDSQTMAFDTLNKEMGQNFSGWDIQKNYNRQVYEYLELLKTIEKDIIVISHDEMLKLDDGTKARRMVVHNKEHEGKVERHFTIVLYTGTRLVNSKPVYFLKTFDADTSAKVSEGLFGEELEIPNDAAYIFSKVEEYYS